MIKAQVEEGVVVERETGSREREMMALAGLEVGRPSIVR